jgi:hypothetical protein
MKNETPEQDWLIPQAGKGKGFRGVAEPPKPISDPVETRHHPVSLLTEYADEASWSERIARWFREHPQGV